MGKTELVFDNDDLLDIFRRMTLIELRDFMREFREEFGVTETAPAILQEIPAEPAEEAEEPTEFTVTLTAAGTGKIQVIKAVREITKLGLKEAKDFVDSLPHAVLENGTKDDCAAVVAKLEAAGASVSVVAVL